MRPTEISDRNSIVRECMKLSKLEWWRGQLSLNQQNILTQEIHAQIERRARVDTLNEFDKYRRSDGINGVKVPADKCGQRYCAYACVEKDCHGFAFFCGDLACSCKDVHRDHIQNQDSWLTIKELQQAIDGSPAIK